MINRIKRLYKAHPFPLATRFCLSELFRSILTPDGTLSYSQTGEDRFLHFLLDVAEKGTYVDVGCNHPIQKSNTLRLYQRGWQGICIDGNKDLTQLYEKLRPLDNVLCQIVSSEEKEVEFIVAKENAVSTISKEHKEEWIGDRVERIEMMQSKTLTSVLEEQNCPQDFELLSVDVEGHDYEVITSLDFKRFSPRFIICELHEKTIEETMENKIYQFLSKHGYVLVAYGAFNGYFSKIKPN